MQLETLRELYIEELKDLYDAERQLVEALPKMAENAKNEKLSKSFTDHLAVTQKQLERLDRIFKSLGTSAGNKKCKGMEGLIEESEELLEEDAQDDVLDAGLISKAQHVEHYEIAGYGTVRTYAVMLGETEHARLLQESLNEEKQTDELLTKLAETSVNIDAVIADSAERQSTSKQPGGANRAGRENRPQPGA